MRVSPNMDMPVEVGNWYRVPVALSDPVKYTWLPILPNAHSDEGQSERHYNLDTRFLSDEDLDKHLSPACATVIPEEGAITEFRPMRCLREAPFHPDYYWSPLYAMFHNASRGLLMRDMKCPHRGTDLTNCPVVDGIVTCPAHGAQWRVSDGTQVNLNRMVENP